MTTELSFLVDLLLNHKLPKPTREAVAARIKVVEENLLKPIPLYSPQSTVPVQAFVGMAAQAPSTQAALARNPDLIPPQPAQVQPAPPPPMSTATQSQVMAERAAAIERLSQGRGAKGANDKGVYRRTSL